MIHGVTDIIDGIGGRDRPVCAWTIVSGVVGVVGGIVVLSSPEVSAATFAWLLGFLLLVQGAIAIIAAFALHRTDATAPSSPAPAAPDAARPATG